MPLNKSKGNMYPWVDYTFTIYRGCRHNCIYCYVKSIQDYDMTPHLVEKDFNKDLGTGRTIFVCSTGDLFGIWMPAEWIERILAYCRQFRNTYLFQTKNPGMFKVYLNHFPSHTIFGTTIETTKNTFLVSEAPPPDERVKAMIALGPVYDKMISIEPIMDFDLDLMITWMEQIKPKFVSIGADSKDHNLPEPSAGKIHLLINHLNMITEVKIKNNLQRLGVF